MIDRLLANAALYEFVQAVTGTRISEAKMREMLDLHGPIQTGTRILDAIWAPRWLPGRLMWSIDQGSQPRTAKRMGMALEDYFELERQVAYSIYHRYFLALARPKSETSPPSRMASGG